ncbi:Protein of unknown function DUF4452, partial [Lasallia pustulata]
MSAYYYGGHHQHHHQHHHPAPPTSTHPGPSSHNHHGGRSRRAPRLSASQNNHKQFRGVKSMKELAEAEAPAITAFRARFEAGRSFDLDDDLEFCPNLLTDDDVSNISPKDDSTLSFRVLDIDASDFQLQSIHSSSSDRSSLSSGSPDSSPLQHQIQPQQQLTPALSLTQPSGNSYAPTPANYAPNPQQLKIHQPTAHRTH